MNLWLLLPIDGSGPWTPWYDKCFGLVIRAETEIQARQIAMENSGNETDRYKDVWINSNYSTCQILTADGEPGLIIRDFSAA